MIWNMKPFDLLQKEANSMICKNCNQETEPGKFCTKCGAPLDASDEQQSAATEEPIIQPSEPTPPPVQQTQHTGQQTQQGQQVDFAEKTKEIGSNFGEFFLNALKKPSSAKDLNGTQYISGIIMTIAFALFISIEHFVLLKKSFDAEFFDHLAVPFLKYVLLFAIIIALIFGAVRIAQQNATIQDVLAKFGAYLVPFILLFAFSIILEAIDMTGLPFSAFGYIAMIGPVLIVPLLILSEKAVKGFDYVYTAVALVLLAYIAYRYINNSVNDFDIPW